MQEIDQACQGHNSPMKTNELIKMKPLKLPKEPEALKLDQAKLFKMIKTELFEDGLLNGEIPKAKLFNLFEAKWFKLPEDKLPKTEMKQEPGMLSPSI